MTVFSLRASGRRNAVSELHGKVSRRMWRGVFPDRSEDQVPIASVTNGVHVPTWVAPRLRALLSRTLGPDWLTRHDEPALWEDLVSVRDDELWRVHLQLKRGFVGLIRERARLRWMRGLTEAGAAARGGHAARPRGAHHRLRATLRDVQAGHADLPRHRAAVRACSRTPGVRCRSSSPARRTPRMTRASISSAKSTRRRSTEGSGHASPSSTTTTCTSPSSWSRAWTCG